MEENLEEQGLFFSNALAYVIGAAFSLAVLWIVVMILKEIAMGIRYSLETLVVGKGVTWETRRAAGLSLICLSSILAAITSPFYAPESFLTWIALALGTGGVRYITVRAAKRRVSRGSVRQYA